MRFGVFELVLGVEVRTRIFCVFGQRAVRPLFPAFEIVVVLVVSDEINGQLAPDEQFVEERFFVSLGGVGVADC